MLLKKIEFQGFKSFVDPTVLNFEAGISAVVGPNGCGKSNISDSIRWVLGEQSAKALRGSKMVDVIFNGTDGRKPSGMAEVSLTISNEDRKLPIDYTEVTITRRAYRSGENEYLVNKVPSRLKDIYRLFADTGVGTDGYSLLEQGKMDLILSSKPMDRRSVFEEAAGITTYKTQRDEALRKLESTDQNLLRVTDIVTEVKRQINSLERQARKAEKYQALKLELDGLQSKFLIKELKLTRTAVADIEREMQSLKNDMDAIEVSMKEKEARISQLQLTLTEDEAALSAATQGVHAIEAQAAQTDKQIELNRSQIVFQGERKERSAKEAAELRARQHSLAGELEIANAERDKEQSELTRLRAELAEEESKLKEASQKRRELSDEAQRLQQKSLENINRRSAVKAEIESFHGRSSQLETRMGQLREELEQAQASLHEAGQKLEAASQMVGGKREEARTMEESLSDQYRRRQEIEEALRLAEEAFSGAQVVLGSHKARLGALEELSKALEGYEAGPKAVLLASGIAGIESLAHKIRTKPEYELAVELGLGHRLQTLLCANVDDGLKALSWLKENKQGRASVAVASEIQMQDSVIPAELLAESGVLGVLSDVLESEESLKPLLRWLGGRQLLVRDLETARRLRDRLPEACGAVTLDGFLLGSEGVFSGGSTETAERGLLSREREMVELREKIIQVEGQVQERQADRERLRSELVALSGDIEKRSAEVKDVQIQIAQLQKEHSSTQESHVRLTRESEDKRKSIEAADVEVAGYRARAESLERQLHEMMQEEGVLKGRLTEVLDQADALRNLEASLQAKLSEMKVQEASASQKSDHLGATVSRLGSDVEQVSEQAVRREHESQQAESEQASLVRKNESLEELLKESFRKREDAKNEVVKAAETRQEHQNEMQSVEKYLREFRAELSDKSEQKHHSEMRAQESKLKLGQIQQMLLQEYHVNLDNDGQEEMNLEAEQEEEISQERIEELKQKVEELGIVNPAAAEEYRELEQRHSLLVGQVEDLRSAKLDLSKVITKINQESRERFIQTFEKVHENFKRIFKTLFGGGEAKLTLMEEGDLLEAGIDIIARPPGKRQQSISLLSGGEKALTAIALLFSLFECKPSPFCVLDEIDAPLDDANISRFTKLLKEYAGKSQFIVITHSKITMETADILYGITMEEAGVSRIISAKFKEDQAVLAS